MSDDLVERVARAMARNQGDDFDQLPMGKSEWTASRGYVGGRYRTINEPMKSDYLDMAEAAIEAMREPTEKMLDAVVSDGSWEDSCAEVVWQAMIDAALKKDKG